MTQEGRVEEFWTTGKARTEDENVRPLLQALAAARRKRTKPGEPVETHVRPRTAPQEASVVVDFRPSEDEPFATPDTEEAETRTTAARIAHDAAEVAAEAAELATAAERAALARGPVVRRRDPVAGRWIEVQPSDTAEPSRQVAGPHWGDLWRNSVQGWVSQADGTRIWRPIVTTTTSVPNWEIDTNLGMVTGESACAVEAQGLGLMVESQEGNDTLRRILERDRETAQEAMVGEAVARGAHAVIGVNLDYTFLGECLIVTSTGTAVTLRSSSGMEPTDPDGDARS